MSNNILFDNIIITEDITVAEDWAAETFNKKRLKIHKESVSGTVRLMGFVSGKGNRL